MSPQAGKPTGPSIQSKLAAKASLFSDTGDYVPCEFSRADLLSLRPEPDVITLTAADEDMLRSLIIAEALDKDNANALLQANATSSCDTLPRPHLRPDFQFG